jgi:pimeloyl-ACP methyl ester carboxylesterase
VVHQPLQDRDRRRLDLPSRASRGVRPAPPAPDACRSRVVGAPVSRGRHARGVSLDGALRDPGISSWRPASCPRATLVVWGQHDTVDSLTAGRASAGALRTQLRVLPGAGHLSMLGAPEALADVVARFANG